MMLSIWIVYRSSVMDDGLDIPGNHQKIQREGVV